MSSARLRQVLLIITFIPWCWLMMMVVHEAGHVLAAWLTGATVERVVLHPLAFSQTVLGDNPQPLVVSWAGALVGSALPLLTWVLLRWANINLGLFARFFAGFCLVANGAYLGMGAWSDDGDAGDLMHVGAQLWHLVSFGVLATALGCWLWHGLGAAFGFRNHLEKITWVAVAVTSALLVMTAALEVTLGRA